MTCPLNLIRQVRPLYYYDIITGDREGGRGSEREKKKNKNYAISPPPPSRIGKCTTTVARLRLPRRAAFDRKISHILATTDSGRCEIIIIREWWRERILIYIIRLMCAYSAGCRSYICTHGLNLLKNDVDRQKSRGLFGFHFLQL